MRHMHWRCSLRSLWLLRCDSGSNCCFLAANVLIDDVLNLFVWSTIQC